MDICRMDINTYVDAHLAELYELIKTLCRIPAPSGQERSRAEFCKQWLELHGAANARLDAAGNAVLELNAQGQNQLRVFTAHMDTVFPDTAPLPVKERPGTLQCPGVYDDTANLAILLMAARFLLERGVRPSYGMLVVADSGEEGLGNLRGCRRLMEDYAGRIAQLISFDLTYDQLFAQAVGSSRYRVTLRTKGGHSFADFGSRNAIVQLSHLISDLYGIHLPKGPAYGKITYNVGRIEGGTSVNTIAQQASMLYEYRSDSAEGLSWMERAFQSTVDICRADGVEVDVELLGTRPCSSNLNETSQRALTETCAGIIRAHTGTAPAVVSGSTDCNIPLSMGIPAVSFGVCRGRGAHTREELLDVSSLKTGLQIALDVMLRFS